MALQLPSVLTFFQERKSEPRVTRAKALSDKGLDGSDGRRNNTSHTRPPEETLTKRRNRNNAELSLTDNESINGMLVSPPRNVSKTRSRSTSDKSHDQVVHTSSLPMTPSKLPNKHTEGSQLENQFKTPSKRGIESANAEPCSPPKVLCTTDSTVGDSFKPDTNTSGTPSTLLKNLTLASPVTKQQSRPLSSRKSLSFPEPEDKLGKARNALHTHAKTSLPGREEELTKLNDFVQNHLQTKTSGSLYISGPPGTGKTACLSQILEQPDLKDQCKVVNINCTSIGSPKAIYSRIASQLGLKVGNKSGKVYLEAIERYLCSNKKMIFLLLDEMDQLNTRSSSLLYTIFEWPLTHPSSIILIGIANALDLTDRILPRLKTKLQLAPQLLHFAPYTKQQLLNIFSQRLEEANALALFHPAALQLLASKVSAVNGDARRALHIARRTVEKESQRMFDMEKDQLTLGDIQMPPKVLSQIHLLSEANSPRKSPRKSTAVIPFQLEGVAKQVGTSPNRMSSPHRSQSPLKSPIRAKSALKENCSPLKPRKSLFKEECASAQSENSEKKEPCIDVRSIMNVVNDVYGTSQSLGRTADGGEELPLHQKLAVSSLLLILREGKSKDVTVGKLHDVYRRVCMKRHMEPLDAGSFLSMLGLIEARGILLLPGRGKRSRLTKVCMQWIEDEVVAALKDRDLLATILKDRACLS